MRRVHFCVRLCREKDGRSGEVSESAEGARLLSGYTVLSCIEGSNPSLSATENEESLYCMSGTDFFVLAVLPAGMCPAGGTAHARVPTGLARSAAGMGAFIFTQPERFTFEKG